MTGKDVNNANKTYNYKGSSISATCVSGYTSTNSNNTVEYTCSGDISSYNGTTLTCQNSGTCHSDKNRSNYQYTNNTYNSSNIGTGFVNGSAIGNTSGNSGNNKNGGTFNSNSNTFSSVSQGVWVRKGECRPIVCKGEKLSTLLSGKNAVVLTPSGSKYTLI